MSLSVEGVRHIVSIGVLVVALSSLHYLDHHFTTGMAITDSDSEAPDWQPLLKDLTSMRHRCYRLATTPMRQEIKSIGLQSTTVAETTAVCMKLVLEALMRDIDVSGVVLAITVPMFLVVWWLLGHPAIQQHLPLTLCYLDPVFKELDGLLEPVLDFVFQRMACMGDLLGTLEGPGHPLGDQSTQCEAALRAKRVLLGLVIVTVGCSALLLLAIIHIVVMMQLFSATTFTSIEFCDTTVVA